MNAEIRRTLIRAEQIRQTRNMPMHAMIMSDIMKFFRTNKIPGGNVFNGTASEEKLAIATEIAAGVLEFCHGEEIGSVMNLSTEEKVELNRRAKLKAYSDLSGNVN